MTPGRAVAALMVLTTICAARAAHAGGFPWKADAAAPAVAGVHLGDDEVHVQQALGSAADVQDLAPDSFALYYKDRGLVVLYDTRDGVEAIYLLQPQAGAIGDIHVGDTRDDVLSSWGEPSGVDGADAIYRTRSWTVAVELGAGQQIVRLSLGRATDRIITLPQAR